MRPARPAPCCRRAVAALACGLWLAGALAPARGEVEVDGVTIRVTKADCRRLVKHAPAPDVAYQPGVDVHGDPVAPADLYDRPRIELPRTVTLPIEVELDRRFGLPDDDSFEGDVRVGTVAVDLDTGRATFNGQPLTAEAEAELRAKCQRVLDGAGE